MALYTKKITLTETTNAEFQRRKKFWERDRLTLGLNTLFTVIEEPLYVPLISENPDDDYVALFERLLNHPVGPRLGVKTSQSWSKYFKNQVDRPDLATIAGIVSAQQPKINYLEVKFYQRDIDRKVVAAPPFHRPVIEFTESVVDGKKAIVSYQICFPREYQSLFRLKTSRADQNFNLVHGFWVP